MNSTDMNHVEWSSTASSIPESYFEDSDRQLSAILKEFSNALQEKKINTDPKQLLLELYLPLAKHIAEISSEKRPFIVGISGTQGSGKSTLADLITLCLKKLYKKEVLNLSIDDFYLTHQERQNLGSTVHPLLATRGVPGTHEIQLIHDVFDQAASDEISAPLTLPQFDKFTDDRLDTPKVLSFTKPIDIVFLEGWCIGAKPQPEEALETPANELEAKEDSDGSWRRYVHSQLKDHYQPLFERFDHLLMLQMPSFEAVFKRRKLQEQKMIQSQGESDQTKDRSLDDSALRRFLMHYERITRHMLEEMPERADTVLQMNDDYLIERVIIK